MLLRIMNTKPRICAMCGTEFEGFNHAKFCEPCKAIHRKEQRHKYNVASRARRAERAAKKAAKTASKQHKPNLSGNIAAANKLGISYGQYVARYVYADDYRL